MVEGTIFLKKKKKDPKSRVQACQILSINKHRFASFLIYGDRYSVYGKSILYFFFHKIRIGCATGSVSVQCGIKKGRLASLAAACCRLYLIYYVPIRFFVSAADLPLFDFVLHLLRFAFDCSYGVFYDTCSSS